MAAMMKWLAKGPLWPFLFELRNKRGLYGWPLWVQRLICYADDIPLSAVGEFPDQRTFSDAVWAHSDPAEMTEYGRRKRADARARLGLE